MWPALGVVLVAGMALLGCTPKKPETALGYHKQTCSALYTGLNNVECGTMMVEETRGAKITTW